MLCKFILPEGALYKRLLDYIRKKVFYAASSNIPARECETMKRIHCVNLLHYMK
jgi:hypothetical protein